jgi:hypothetical protein
VVNFPERALARRPISEGGFPNWGRPIPPAPALPTEFELRGRLLHLTLEMYTSSREHRYLICPTESTSGLSPESRPQPDGDALHLESGV